MTKLDVLRWMNNADAIDGGYDEIVVWNDDCPDLIWDEYSDEPEITMEGCNFTIDEFDIEKHITNVDRKNELESIFERRREYMEREKSENEYWGEWNSREDDAMDSRRGL